MVVQYMVINQLTLTNIDTEKRFDYRLDEQTDTSNVQPNKQYSVLESFAGAGGLALGFEMAGLHSVGAIELDKHAVNTLKANRPQWNVIQGNVNDIVGDFQKQTNIDPNSEIDVFSGGFPCQSFSYAGKGLGFNDTRGTLFHPFAQIIDLIKPKVFVAENVKGLVNHDSGRTLSTMIHIFKHLGYQISWNVLNAWDYNTAQKRERIFIVGIHNDLVAKQSIAYQFPEPFNQGLTLRDVLQNVPESPGATYSENKYKVLDLVPAGGCWRDLPEDIAKDYMKKSWYSGGGKTGMARRLSWDEPSLTLTTSPSQKQTERCHPDETRPFTVREYARIQGFPDDWIFTGGVGAQYKQIGNAVPVNLAKHVGLSVIKYLNQF